MTLGSHAGDLIYREMQRFAEWFRGLMLFVVGLGGASLVLISLTQGLLYTELCAGVCLIFVGGFLAFEVKMVVEVREGGVFVRFWPFPRMRIDTRNVTAIRAVHYRPILDYGGWGLRLGYKKRAYCMRGNLGVRLDYSDGSHILIGSQNPLPLAVAIGSVLGTEARVEIS